MNNLETNKNTSPKAEATTPAFPISPAIPQLQCRVRDFVAASQYAASPVEGSSVGRTVSGDVWLSGISRWLYNDIIDQITIKTSTTGTKVAQLNGKEFFQTEIGFSAETGICQDTSSLFTPEEPQQGLCPYASLPQDIF